MKSKLSLSLKSEVIESAKRYASKRKTSASALVENYFIQLTSQKKKKYVADELAGILDEKKLRKLKDDRINHWLNK